MSEHKVAVLVSSCDKYQACWEPFIHGFRKYWPDCPWPTFFVTNYLDAPFPKYQGTTIKVGKDNGWANTTLKALEQIDSEVVLFMLDDFWLANPTNTKALVDFADILLRGDADYIRLVPTTLIEPNVVTGASTLDTRLNVFRDTARYRGSLNPSLWRTEHFRKMLKKDENPWEFEIHGGKRSRGYRHLLVKEFAYIYYVITTNPLGNWGGQPVKLGKWTPAARQYAQVEGLTIDTSKNPVEELINPKV